MARASWRVAFFLVTLCYSRAQTLITDEEEAKQWLEQYNTMAEHYFYLSEEANWAYETDINGDQNQQAQVQASLDKDKFKKEAYDNSTMFDVDSFTNETVKRLFSKIKNIGNAGLRDQNKLNRLTQLLADMKQVYSTGKVKDGDRDLVFEPDLVNELATGRDYDRLQFIWKGWRDAVGPTLRDMYKEYVTLKNEAIGELGYDDVGDYWRSWYETPTFEADLEALWQEVRPMYLELHAYVRRRLGEAYGKDKVGENDPIPAHLFGNMWSQQWNNIYDLVEPFSGKQRIDVTSAMVAKGWDAMRMFNESEQFFTSLGLIPMTPNFWRDSMIVRPADREVVCYASAWDFYNRRDFRIKMCTEVTQDDLQTVHHEMGHIEYFLQYKDQPVPFREGANPGFHEAVGDCLALSVSTPKHLKEIGLIDGTLQEDDEADINYLMKQALEKIAFLPFAYMMDQWRWKVFDGRITPDNMNQEWWKLRQQYQGIIPPVLRDENDFDPGCKFHIPSDVPYIRYFVSFIIQFQFYEAMCDASDHTGPLYKCDFYRSPQAGQLLGDMLKLGSSRPWPEAMEAITGSRAMTARPLLKYFEPLTTWLRQNNTASGARTGWSQFEPWASGATKVAGSTVATTLFCVLCGLFCLLK
ncbi:angiotensin-converting enzyme-like [Branchiostoma lanceolatum]|uniref:angiotensin-converting enzyme-like n=1 Tax=Branchiostoma lanceolatum TaxID=7740 RepID=UPI003452846C